MSGISAARLEPRAAIIAQPQTAGAGAAGPARPAVVGAAVEEHALAAAARSRNVAEVLAAAAVVEVRGGVHAQTGEGRGREAREGRAGG